MWFEYTVEVVYACTGTSTERQSVRLFLQSSELGPPHRQASVSPLWFRGGGDTLAWARGGEGVPIPTWGQTLCYSSRPTLRIIVTYERLLSPIPHIRLHLYQPFTGSQEADTIYLALNRSCSRSHLHPWRSETLIPFMGITVHWINQSPSRLTFIILCQQRMLSAGGREASIPSFCFIPLAGLLGYRWRHYFTKWRWIWQSFDYLLKGLPTVPEAMMTEVFL